MGRLDVKIDGIDAMINALEEMDVEWDSETSNDYISGFNACKKAILETLRKLQEDQDD